MDKSTSLYLDLLRVVAAFGVVLVHANLSWFSNNLFFPEELGHKLVMVFFVLSGYLIAFTVDKKNKGSEKYLIDRLSRLYSVVLPALVFTYIIDYIGKHFNASLYASQVAPDQQFLRFLLNAGFLSQIWNLCTKPSSNGPFWSLSYEFWYYMLFWAFIYLKALWKYLGLLMICLIVGPKILLLFPVWLFGVMVYHASTRVAIGSVLARVLFLFTTVFLVILTFYWDFSFFSDRFIFGSPPLFFSSRFVFDWIYGAIVAVNLFSVSYITLSVKIPVIIETLIKYLSSITFSLYLYHLPLLIFAAAVIPYNKSSYIQLVVIIIGIILISGLLSQITEKQRPNLKALIEKVFSMFKKAINY